MLVGQRNDEAVEPVGLQLLAQRREPIRIGGHFAFSRLASIDPDLVAKGALRQSGVGTYMRLVAAMLLLIATPLAAQSQMQRGSMTPSTSPAAGRAAELPAPPRAEQRPHSFEHHGIRVDDPWHWLKDDSYPNVDDADVLSYLRAENSYFEAAMAPHRPLIDTLFQEMRGRIPEDDSSVPVRDGDWLYWWAFQPGAQYRTWYRRPAGGPSPGPGQAAEAQVIYDEPAEATGKQYFRLGALEISPDGRHAAIMVDDDGSERFQLKIRDLATGRDVETVTDVGIGDPVWTADSRGDRLHRGQRQLAQLSRPPAPARPAESRATAPSMRRPRMSPSRSRSAAPRTAASS